MYRIMRLEEQAKGCAPSSDCGKYYLFDEIFKSESDAKQRISELVGGGQFAKRFKVVQELPITVQVIVK